MLISPIVAALVLWVAGLVGFVAGCFWAGRRRDDIDLEAGP